VHNAIVNSPLGRPHIWRSPACLSVVVVAAFVACYWRVITALPAQWAANDTYSYGFLIPPISAYLIWRRRSEVRRLPVAPDLRRGLPVLGLGLGLLVTGYRGGILALEGLALVVTAAAVILMVLGAGYLRALWFPVAYLLMMIPVWETVTDSLQPGFQMASAKLGVSALRAFGIPVHQTDTYIHLPNVVLEVGEACSGVSYLIAVVAIGTAAARLYLRHWAPQVVLLGFAVGVSVLANGARVALIGVLAYYESPGAREGPLHVLHGLSVSVVGYAALFGGLGVLKRRWAGDGAGRGTASGKKDASCERRPVHAGASRAYGAAALVAMALMATAAYLALASPREVPPAEDLRVLPTRIGQWEVAKGGVDVSADYWRRGADQELHRTYRSASGDLLHLYIGYYSYQSHGKEFVNYRVRHLVGTAQAANVSVAATSPRKGTKASTVVVPIDGRQYLMAYWYDLGGRVVATPHRAMAATVWRSLSTGKSNGAVVAVSAELQNGADPADAAGRIEQFVALLVPELEVLLP
jgi:EpsI family protein